jgi:hypothetical protein
MANYQGILQKVVKHKQTKYLSTMLTLEDYSNGRRKEKVE